MSVGYQLPTQARFIATSTIFTAVFNAITPGRYNFTDTLSNQNVTVIQLQPNTVYYIDKMSVAGNITEEQYLESIDTFPTLYIKKKIKTENVYQNPIPIANYYDGNEISAWINSDKKDDELQFTFQGLLAQPASMVGIGTVKIQVSLNIFAMDSSFYNAAFRDMQAPTMGQRNRT